MAKYKIVGRGIENDPEALRLLDEHDREDEEAGQVGVNLSFSPDQMRLVRRAAQLLGVPAEDYMKQLVVSGAVDNVKLAEHVLTKARSG